MESQPEQLKQASLLAQFGDRFLRDHAGQIVTDPKIAVVELVANAWDAGADKVELRWFDDDNNIIEIKDNGTGMSSSEFKHCWTELNYNRREAHGDDVVFPQGNISSKRKVFGKNGKGRHAMFCFSAGYFVETTKNGIMCTFRVSRVSGRGNAPFTIDQLSTKDAPNEQHGTRIWAESEDIFFSSKELRNHLGSKFIADPAFNILVNDEVAELTDLSHLFDEYTLEIPGVGVVPILLIDTTSRSKTTRHHGVAWWVNNRLVGDVGWNKLSGDSYLDGRMSNAKQYTFVVKADVLEEHVLEDWSGFQIDVDRTKLVAEAVDDYISGKLFELAQSTFDDRKRQAIEDNADELIVLSQVSTTRVGKFVDQLQMRSPSMKVAHLSHAVEVFAMMEKNRSGYLLLQQLANLTPDDLDGISHILKQWSVNEAMTVLDELHKRLKLLERMEELVDDPSSDELHDLQPLFESGLWIFGPEFESVEFRSNRSLLTVVRTLFGDHDTQLDDARRRPDLVALPDASVGIYATEQYNVDGEVDGIAKVLIVELKRGGFKLSRDEIRQAEDYEIALRKSGKISQSTIVVAYVLGSQLGEDAREPVKKGKIENTFIHPMAYNTVLRRAHARTFHLAEKIKKSAPDQLSDPIVDKVLREEQMKPTFSFAQNGKKGS